MTWASATKYKLILEINNAILKETTRSGLFRSLATEIRKIFHYDRFSINLYHRQKMILTYFDTADGISPAGISEGDRPVHKGAIAGAVIQSRKPLIIDDLSQYSYWESARIMLAAGLKATMAFPLIVRDEVIGTLHFSFVNAPDNPDLADFLADLSKQVAIAVDNILSYIELKAMNEQLKRQKEYLLAESDHSPVLEDFYYTSPVMRDLMSQVSRLAQSDASVLITGETGTGKDHIARCIHNLSDRREALFVKVNCPALTSTLFESELFGHAKGAFTGAHAQRIGRFEMADGGTIFLDEIGELELPLQAKLLYVLQDRIIERVGDNRSIQIDFRLIAATNKDLSAAIKDKSFRTDLFYRLNTYSLHIPPLRERVEDIPFLIEQLTAEQAAKTHRKPPTFSPSCLDLMRRYAWPGNVRELKNIIKRLVLMAPGDLITSRDFEAIIGQWRTETLAGHLTLAEIEREHILRTLAQTKGAVGGPNGAAAILGLPRQTLQYRMKKYGLTASSWTDWIKR